MFTRVLCRQRRALARPRRTPYRPRLEALEERSLLSLGLGGLVVPDLARQDRADRAVTVMTRNLYVGAEISPVLDALASGNPSAIIGAVSTVWASVLSTNFHERAEALADEIGDAGPLLIGLQEVSLFRTGAADSFFGNPTQADQVELDYLEILL